MSHETDTYEDLVLPVLLQEARAAYTRAIREGLAAAGLDDMPRAGSRVIGRIARGGTNVTEVAGAYGVSKQAASQLVDTLVARGYVERVPDAVDRRRMTVALTDRGRAAAAEIRAAIDRVDGALVDGIGAAEEQRMRRALGALAELRHGEPPPRRAAAPTPGPGRPTLGNGKLCYVELPATDVAASAAFYADVFSWSIRTRDDGHVAFDDAVGEVSGTWVLDRPPAADGSLLVYVMVDDAAAALDAVLAHGGEVVQPIGADAPEITARFADPAGNVLGLYQQP